MNGLRFLPQALREYLAGVRWYEQQREGLGAKFAAELEARLQLAVEVPGAGRLELDAPERFALRWYKLRRFPFALLIGRAGSERVVVAVAHERRRPGYWKRRINALDS